MFSSCSGVLFSGMTKSHNDVKLGRVRCPCTINANASCGTPAPRQHFTTKYRERFPRTPQNYFHGIDFDRVRNHLNTLAAWRCRAGNTSAHCTSACSPFIIHYGTKRNSCQINKTKFKKQCMQGDAMMFDDTYTDTKWFGENNHLLLGDLFQ